MEVTENERGKPAALALLSSSRPRNVGWIQAAGLLFGDWGTSRLYVLGLAFLLAGRTSFYLIGAMSLLILAVGWAYTQICRIYADGGGVYTAASHHSRLLGVVGALLLFADYTVTASLSALDAFHYFGLGGTGTSHVAEAPADEKIVIEHGNATTSSEPLWTWRSPGLWAIAAIIVIGAFNLLGPRHTAGFAVLAAGGMIVITLLVVISALPQIHWRSIDFGSLNQAPTHVWQAFVGIVLALSGVEAIANLTGVMRRPVYGTASKSIWTVAIEVAVFNLVLATIMVAVAGLGRHAHKEDMLAYLAGSYIGAWGEWPVRIIGGLLLLSATNTAINGLISITYVMSRDGEMPQILQKLNSFGAPWVAAALAAGAPAVVLLFAHDLERLASLYAIGVVGAVAINITLCSFHPRLRRWRRKILMFALGMLLVGIEITLAFTKLHALLFVFIVLAVGLTLRQITRFHAARRAKPSLLRRAIMEQLTPTALAGPKLLLATAGSAQLSRAAMEKARQGKTALVVCFVRELALSYMFKSEGRLTLDTDPAAQALFTEFLQYGYEYGVPIIPMYDTATDAAESIAEAAAINAVQCVLIGSSRRGSLHQLIKGSFQRKLEALLPPEIPVQVLSLQPVPAETATAKMPATSPAELRPDTENDMAGGRTH
jgi:amino acid transporter